MELWFVPIIIDQQRRGSTVSVFRLLSLLRVLRLCLFQNEDVGVGVFPEGEEVLGGGFCLGGVALHGISPTQAAIAASRTPLWLASGWGCPGRCSRKPRSHVDCC